MGSARRVLVGRHRWFVASAALLAALLFQPATGSAASDLLTQSRLEAVYLYKFASFVTWPGVAFDSPTTPIVVGVYNDRQLARELEQVARGKRINGRALEIRQVDGAEDARDLHVLFLGARSNGQAAVLLESVAGQSVLTVSDDPAVHARGTMVNFVVVEQRVRFDVALAPVRRSKLRVSALMLTAARDVARSGG